MNARQSKLYVHKTALYKPKDLQNLVFRDIKSLVYSESSKKIVYGYMNTKPEISQDSYIGRMLASGTFVSICEISYEDTVDVNTNDIVQFLAEGHPNYGEWYQVVGNPKVKNWKAQKLTVYVHRVIKPRFE